ncbi:small, acid-soluble spore protein, alpha/beta type [Clostridium sp. MB40-C1]|uniref:small, acid-soluble spore protein, alpha/beta type n=1 Tax=Clostridium sp. MB40-C1 TaxID=3070996 RepID=UPI0027E07EEA|nr:small, acid-soluble spore protein, alpha/beta type [Clostridium sp. MB40-C1]WMJ80298.1 small, acid-soluble spore protein, alpha/beta type [Clostridium sp. MB40-C1]
MSHKDNKNSKEGKKVNPKTKKELAKMKIETSNELGYSNESRKLGKNKERQNKQRSKNQ